MKLQTIILTSLALLCSLPVNGHTIKYECDNIYDFAETIQHYKNDVEELIDYLVSDLLPILEGCSEVD